MAGIEVAIGMVENEKDYQQQKNLAMKLILESGAVEIRDVDSGEDPFLYSTKNRGPGYIDIKGRIGFDEVFEAMTELLFQKLVKDDICPELLVGMMTGGSLPGYRLKQKLAKYFQRRVVYIYQRGARKVGGHLELDTGDRSNPYIKQGCNTLVVEELVNFAGTTTNGVLYERKKNRAVDHAACILFYENPVAIKKLKKHNINLHYAIGLQSDLLPFAVDNGFFSIQLAELYLSFLKNPKEWNESRGFKFYS